MPGRIEYVRFGETRIALLRPRRCSNFIASRPMLTITITLRGLTYVVGIAVFMVGCLGESTHRFEPHAPYSWMAGVGLVLMLLALFWPPTGTANESASARDHPDPPGTDKVEGEPAGSDPPPGGPSP